MTHQEYLKWCKDMAEHLEKYEYHFTNADHIRSMTDEELAYFLADAYTLGAIQEKCRAKAWERWLKEEVKT